MNAPDLLFITSILSTNFLRCVCEKVLNSGPSRAKLWTASKQNSISRRNEMISFGRHYYFLRHVCRSDDINICRRNEMISFRRHVCRRNEIITCMSSERHTYIYVVGTRSSRSDDIKYFCAPCRLRASVLYTSNSTYIFIPHVGCRKVYVR